MLMALDRPRIQGVVGRLFNDNSIREVQHSRRRLIKDKGVRGTLRAR